MDEKKDKRVDFMTDEEIKMVDGYLAKLSQNRGYMNSEYYSRWEKEEEAYKADQPIIENRPNSRINIINANIEGQIASIVDQNLAVICRGEGPSDDKFSKWGEIGIDWTLRKNRIKRVIERHEKRRGLHGAGIFKVYWDADAVNKFGLAKITCPPLTKVFFDNKVKDILNLQEADYIAEVMPKSKTWAENKFGEKIASVIDYGFADRDPIFTEDKTTDDEDTFYYIQLWTMTDKKLRLLEISECGILLADSFKDKDGKKLKSPKPYYKYNKYPYFITNMYHEEGKLLGFGDGKLLRPLQDMINDLYDQIRRASRPNRVFFDPNSEVDLEELDTDDGPIPCNDPSTTIRVVEVGKPSSNLWGLLSNIHTEAQRVTRFSELMTGQGTKAQTATEAAIQQQQGNTSVDHKKTMLQDTLVEVCEYCLSLMMENYTEAKAFRISEDKEDFLWIDFNQLNDIPMMVPADSSFEKEYRERNDSTPEWMQLMDGEKGKTKEVEFDIEINIGAGLPKNKAFIYEMLEKLATIVLDGRNLISWTEFRKLAKDFLGLPLDDDDEVTQQMQQEQMQAQAQGMLQSPDTMGLSQHNAPMMGGGMGG